MAILCPLFSVLPALISFIFGIIVSNACEDSKILSAQITAVVFYCAECCGLNLTWDYTLSDPQILFPSLGILGVNFKYVCKIPYDTGLIPIALLQGT